MLGLAFVAAVLGFAALAMALNRHHQQVWRRAPSRRRQRLLRIAGWALLLASLWMCIAYAGWASGLVWWFGLLTAGALAVAMVLAWRPRWLGWVALSQGGSAGADHCPPCGTGKGHQNAALHWLHVRCGNGLLRTLRLRIRERRLAITNRNHYHWQIYRVSQPPPASVPIESS